MNQSMLPNKFSVDKVKTYPVWSHIDHDGVRFCARFNVDELDISYESDELTIVDNIRVRLLSLLQSLTEKYPSASILIDGKFMNDIAIIYDTSIPGSYESRWNTLSEYIDIEPTQGALTRQRQASALQLVSYSVHNDMESITEEYLRAKREGIDVFMVRDPRADYESGYTDSVLRLVDMLIVHTVPSIIKELYLLVSDGYMTLIDTEDDDILGIINNHLLISSLVEDIVPRLESNPESFEIRFPVHPEQDKSQIGQVVCYSDTPIKIVVVSHSYNVEEKLLIVNAAFVK